MILLDVWKILLVSYDAVLKCDTSITFFYTRFFILRDPYAFGVRVSRVPEGFMLLKAHKWCVMMN